MPVSRNRHILISTDFFETVDFQVEIRQIVAVISIVSDDKTTKNIDLIYERTNRQAIAAYKTFIRPDCLREGQAQTIEPIEFKNEVLNINCD
jgi:hypothetical protein